MPQLDRALAAHRFTSRALTQAYLRRVRAFDHGVVKVNAQGRPALADVEEIHGKDVVKSCDEVAKLRAAAAEKKK